MRSVTANEARRTLFALLDDVAETHEPVLIMGKDHNGVLVSTDDWRAIQEALHLAQIPGMVESIREGLATPPASMSEDLDGWAVRPTSRGTRT
jgi:antitoxin YefM